MADERELEAFERRLMEAVRARATQRSRQQEREQTGTEPEKSTQRDQRDNPLDAPSRHRADNARRQEERLRTIGSEERRAAARATVETYYEAWTRALKKAYATRYDMSPRFYERRLAERRIDERLIPAADKEKMHAEAIREAVSASQMRMKEINEALPEMIDKTIDDAARYKRDRAPQMGDPGYAEWRARNRSDKERER